MKNPKYDHNKALEEHKDIMSEKPDFLKTEQELKESVIKNLPKVDNPDTRDFMVHLGIEKPANTPAEGLEKKMKYWKDKDNSVQERIRYSQSWNLAAQLVSTIVGSQFEWQEFVDEPLNGEISGNLEFWQKYFYGKLGENGNE